MSVALQRLISARPQLSRVVTAGAAHVVAPRELLHAGPPLRDPHNPPAVLRSSVLVTCIHEGWANDFETADALLREGSIRLSPAQDRGCVTPLAAVVSAGTPMLEVTDAAMPGGAKRCLAPVSTVNGVDTRAGNRDLSVFARLRTRDTIVAPALQRLLQGGPIPLWPLAAHGLAHGDDLHSRVAAANEALADRARFAGSSELAAAVSASPLFFLTLWMAGCALVLRSAEGLDLPALVTRAGGNGERFAIALAGSPERWVAIDAEPPRGRLSTAVAADTAIAPAIGDSAVIDVLGLGAQRLALAPDPLVALGPYVPAECGRSAASILAIHHPMIDPPWRIGLDAEVAVAQNAAPLVALAMLAADGVGGLIGRGVYAPPLDLFRAAIARR